VSDAEVSEEAANRLDGLGDVAAGAFETADVNHETADVTGEPVDVTDEPADHAGDTADVNHEPADVTGEPADHAGDVVEAGESEGGAEPAGEEPVGFSLPAPMSRMLFVDIVLVLPSTHPVVVLQEADMPYRELRIPIGGPEGIAIGYAARQVATPRPLTHELMTDLLTKFNLSLDVVRITGLSGGMFTAELAVSGPGGQRLLDCRPSDAIALALRQRIAVPIMADPDVLDRAAGAAAGSN
jgi:uncharacterized protein